MKGQPCRHISNTDIQPMSQAATLKRRSFFLWLAKHLYYCGNQVKRSTFLWSPFVSASGRVCVCVRNLNLFPSYLQQRPCLPVLPRLPVSINPPRHVTPINLFVIYASVCPPCIRSFHHSSVISLPPLLPLLFFESTSHEVISQLDFTPGPSCLLSLF